MQINGKDVYFVAVKLLLRDGNKLLITHDVFDAWDLPGGRLKAYEFDKPLDTVIKRKVHEELGEEVNYVLGEPKVFFRVERFEKEVNMKVRIFAIGYEAQYKGGNIVLGKNHDKYEWVNVKTFQPETLFDGGWLRGIQEYLG